MSHRPARRAALAAFCLLPLAAPLIAPLIAPRAIAAEPPTPEQAQLLEQQLRAWYAATFGAGPAAPDHPARVTAEGDHYRIAAPFAGLFGARAEGAGAVTAAMRPLPDGTWSLDDIRVPSPQHFTMTLAAHPQHGKGPGAPVPVDVNLTLADQKAHAVFDPSYAAPSTFTGSYGAFDMRLDSAVEKQTQHFDGYTVNASLRPAAGGRIDVLEDVVAHGYASTQHDPDGHELRLQAARMQIASHLDAVDRTRVPPVMQAAMRLSGAMMSAMDTARAQPGAEKALPPLDRTTLHDLLLALRDVASGGEVDETLDGLHVAFDTHTVDLAHAALGLGAEAPGGMLEAHLALALDGLQVPELPLQANQYMPRHIELRPMISGVSVADLTRMGLMATEPDFTPSRLGPQVDTLLSHGGITVGFETLAFDIGPAKFSGRGKVLVHSSADQTGQAEIEASGFDALMQKVQKDPALSEGFPVLVLARGLARPSGDRLVWTIDLQGDRLTVNGTDLSSVLGGKPAQKR